MKRISRIGCITILCLYLLAGCGDGEKNSSSIDEVEDSSMSQMESPKMTTEQLHQYFRQIFDAKGNALDTPEQLALELSEVKALTDTAALPEDYEEQYKVWRSEQIKAILEELYSEYDGIISELPQNSGPIPGACYAERIDFENDGIPELFILTLEPILNYGGMDTGLEFAMQVYGLTSGGHAEKIGEENLGTSVYDSIGLCKSGEATFINARYNAGGTDAGGNDYYGIKDGQFTVVDNIHQFADSEINYTYTSFDKPVSADEYEKILAKYSETDVVASLDHTNPSVNSRGILPPPSPDVLRRAVMVNALNNSGAEYAYLADMDGDGIEDLVTLENYSFHAYIWDGTTVHAIDLGQIGGVVYGIYREKSTGKIYVAYEDPLITAYYFERVSEVVTIDEDTYSFEDCYIEIDNRFEKIVNDDVLFNNYEAIEDVRQQLIQYK